MRRFRIVGAVVALLASAVLLIHCSGKDKGTNSGPRTVEMQGAISFPAGAAVDLGGLTLGFADSDQAVDSIGAVRFKGTEHVPGLAFVTDPTGSVLLLGVTPDPQENQSVLLDARSTALALVFMNPFVCQSVRNKAVQAIADIDALPQVDTLEAMLTQKLAVNPNCLELDDAQLAGVITRAINAYIELHDAESASPPADGAAVHGKPIVNDQAAASILISPTTQTGGHLLTHVGDNTFNITNAYGRWALLVVPQTGKQIFLPPNGSMLDFFYDGVPWAPSNTTFSLTVDQPDDTQKVFVYGYGLKNDAESYWEALTAEEKTYADKAGCFTFVFELLGGAVDVVCASNSALSGVEGWEKECEITETEFWLLDFLLNDAYDMSQVHTLAKEGRYGDLAWFVFKTVFEKITTDETYRLRVESIMKSKLSEKQLKRMDWLASNPATYAIGAGINIGNKVTNVMKTAYGIKDARFKTTFRIWKSNEDFGGITGHVMQKESPFGPIAGANVHLGGDDNNPIPGHVTDVTTDADGGFMFTNVMSGAKSLTATKAGYNDRSVDVTVSKNQVANVTIELSKKVGRINGLVVNEIFSKARQYPEYASHDTLFDNTLYIYARGRVANQPYEDSRTISNGRYSFDLPAGTFWIVAIHPDNDYAPDSLQVTVVENETRDAARALRMKPSGSVSAVVTAYGSASYNLNFQYSGATPALSAPGIPPLMLIEAYSLGHDTDAFDFFIDLRTVTEPNMYDAGTEYGYYHGTQSTTGGFSDYATSRLRCVMDQVSRGMYFIVRGNPDEIPCDCGVSPLGTIYFSAFGKELGDVIAGSVNVTLTGSRTCECVGHDDNMDGKYDRFDVVCQNLDLDVTFRLVVGSTILMPLPQGQAASLATPEQQLQGVSQLIGR